ncbi:hypothetical protein ACLK19_23930 [Escherichia coli]
MSLSPFILTMLGARHKHEGDGGGYGTAVGESLPEAVISEGINPA